MRAAKKCNFIKSEHWKEEVCGHIWNFGLFYHEHSPNKVMSREGCWDLVDENCFR